MRGTAVLLLLVLVCGGSVAWALLHPRPRPPLPALTVEVVNGCGAEGLAARAAVALRALGQDVLTTENAARHDYPRSVLVDRRGRPWLARRLAERIGPVVVVLQQTPGAAADVSLVLGQDYARLRLLGRPAERRGGWTRWLPGWLRGGAAGRPWRPAPPGAALPPLGAKCYLAGGERLSIREVARCPGDLWVSWP